MIEQWAFLRLLIGLLWADALAPSIILKLVNPGETVDDIRARMKSVYFDRYNNTIAELYGRD